MKRLLRLVMAALTMGALALPLVSVAGQATPAAAAIGDTGTSSGGWGGNNARMQYTVVGQAAPDECWAGVGVYAAPSGYDSGGGVICPSGFQPKVNQAYVWGLTQTNSGYAWFGTVANTQCLVMGSYLGLTTPIVNDTSVCEFGSSPMITLFPGLPNYLGDWRPPQLFTYPLDDSTTPVNLVKKLPDGSDRGLASQSAIAGILNTTVGIRSAGTVADPLSSGQVVFFAGPSLLGGINVLAFHDDGTFIGGTTLSAYNDIRRWVTVGSDVFAGVGKTGGGGAVVKWDPPEPGGSYFDFTEVQAIPGNVAELTVAGSRLVAGTWPGVVGSEMASVYVSPADTAIGDLSTNDTWTRVWRASDYDPDLSTAYTYGTGAMAYYGGYVYWGTMHVPGTAFEAAEQTHPSATAQETLANFVGSYRAISIYRMRMSGSTPGPVQLLYGEAQLPAYDYTGETWQLVDNNMGGVSGLYGSSGFGNLFNNYEWSMAISDDQLYVGTMDWSYLASQVWPQLLQELGLPADTPNPIAAVATYGADLFRFSSTRQGAQALFEDGVGNELNYGVRNMLTTDSGLLLGMADPENLATSPSAEQGGWELIGLTQAEKSSHGNSKNH